MNNRVRTGNFLYNTARLYHYSIGVNGGYFNLGMNYTQQSIASGNFGLEGKSISSLSFSAFTPYSASVRGQIALGVSDPWANISYNKGKGAFGLNIGGYMGGYSDVGSAALNSAAGFLGPYGGWVAKSTGLGNPYFNYILYNGLQTQLQWIGTNAGTYGK